HQASARCVSGEPRGSSVSEVAPPATPNYTEPPRTGAARAGLMDLPARARMPAPATPASACLRVTLNILYVSPIARTVFRHSRPSGRTNVLLRWGDVSMTFPAFLAVQEAKPEAGFIGSPLPFYCCGTL